jgi:hypothetical protein
VPGDGSEQRLRESLVAGRRELAAYLGAGLLYVAIGVAFPEFLFAWVVAACYLVLCLVIVPALVRQKRS